MYKKISLALLVTLLTISCASDNPNNSKVTAYSSCSIIDSNALFANDRAKDNSQNWDSFGYKEKSLAEDWCGAKVSAYIANEYIFGHSVQYRVVSTN